MRFTYAESMIDPTFYLPLAQAAEEAGFDSMIVPDGLFYPEHAQSRYPYNPDGSREFLEDKPFLDPFSLVSAMGAVTRQLRFVTFVLKLPVRNPVLVAKQATSAAVLTGNRLVLGVGTSPWREDYEVLQVPWERRGRRMDEAMDIVRGLSEGGWFEHHGEIFSVPGIKISPVPTERLAILVGGHGDAALRRAVERGDGWLHGGGDPALLGGLLTRLRELRKEAGTLDRPFDVYVISMDAFSAEGVRRLHEQGVTHAIVGFRWPYEVGPEIEPLADKVAKIRWFGETVIDKVAT